MTHRGLINAAVVLWLTLAFEVGAEAHAFRPALLDFSEISPGQFEVLWMLPARLVDGVLAYPVGMEAAEPRLPDHCQPTGLPRSTMLPEGIATHWQVDCGERGLTGGDVGVRGLSVNQGDVLLRISSLESDTQTAVLTADSPSVRVGDSTPDGVAASSSFGAFRVYLDLGIGHILLGVDHLLFVLGLLLLVDSRRALVLTITTFTLAHSDTLGLAVLGVVDVPTRPVEAAIALSVVFLAVELTRSPVSNQTSDQTVVVSWTRRYPWAIALAFGLLHGFGFAGALRELGLPAAQVPIALFGFNVGVEIGQLLFVSIVVLLAGLFKRFWTPRYGLATRVAAYAIGSMAVFWLIERVARFWEGVV